MNTRRDDSSPRRAETLAWGAVGALLCGAMTPLEPNMLEEGMILEIAQRILRGDHLYQDVVAFTGPLPFEALALLFRLFGEEIFVARAAVALLHGGATAGVFALARRTRTDGFEHLAAVLMATTPILLFPLLSTYFYTTLAVSIGVLAAWASLRALREPGWALVAGILIALAALCKQTVGAVLAVGLFISVLANLRAPDRLRTALGMIAGGLLVTIATLLAFAATGGVGALFHSLVTLPLSFESSFSSPLMNFWPPGEFSQEVEHSQGFYLPYFYTLIHGGWGLRPGRFVSLLTQTLYALPFAALAITLLRRRRGPLPSAVWIHLALLIAMISNLFPRADWGHLVSVLPSAAIQLVLVVPYPTASSRRRRRIAVTLIATTILGSLAVAGSLYWFSGEPTFGPRIPLRIVNPGFREETVPHAIRYLREHTKPGDSIFVARAEPLLYFATDTRNPTPYSGVIPGMRDEQQRVIVEALETTRYVVMTDIDQPVFTYYRDELPRVQRALERRFRIPEDYLRPGSNWMIVLERGPDRGATSVDFIDIASSGRPWIRTRTDLVKRARTFHDPIGTIQNRRLLPFFLGERGGGIDFDVTIPKRAVFQASVGFPAIGTGSKRVFLHPRSSRLMLSIKDGDRFEKVMDKVVSIDSDAIARWIPFEADLSEFAGQPVTVRLQLEPIRPIEQTGLAWWGSPRIAIRPAPNPPTERNP